MKLPNIINICGSKWKIKRDDSRGGCFDCKKEEIRVGNTISDDLQKEAFLHEVVESILSMLSYRYDSTINNDDLIFVVNHKEMENFVKHLKIALEGIKL